MNSLSPMKFGIILALLTLLFGYGLGIAFGAAEENIKNYLTTEGQSVFEEVYKGDEEKLEATTSKSWVYFKRAHLHANGLGTSTLALILLLSCLAVSSRAKSLTATALGVGSLGYSVFWLLAGMSAPALGSTDTAKESLGWLAIPSAALCLIGLLSVLLLTFKGLSNRSCSAGN